MDDNYLVDLCDEYLWDLDTLYKATRRGTLRAMMSVGNKFNAHASDKQTKQKQQKRKGDLHLAESAKSRRKISHIKDVNSLQSMKQWIALHKESTHDKQCIQCCSCGNKSWTKSKGSDTMPMYMWQWQDVVALIESMDDIKHFASVFWQYKIDGKELCTMTQKQIEYLIECSLLNNHKLKDENLNALRYNTERRHLTWPITQEARILREQTDKIRIRQHIICQYRLAIDLLKHFLTESEYPGIQEDAEKIFNLIQLLRVNVNKGPKHFWKMEPVPFFNKIDNFLAVLLAPKRLRQAFAECYPDFLQPPAPVPHESEAQTTCTEETHTTTLSMSSIFSDQLMSPRNSARSGASVSADVLDKCVDMMCSHSKYTLFIHNTDRLYLKALGCFILPILFGVILVSIWYYSSAKHQCDVAMNMAIEIIGKRTRNQMLHEFWIPQMIMNTAISAIQHSTVLTKNAADTQVFHTHYDEYLASFSSISNTDNVWALWLYNNDTNGFIGAFRDNDEIVISQYNGTCRIEWYYNTHTKQRDLDRPYDNKCAYIPRERPWYHMAVEELGINKAGWTQVYPFASNNYAGMSLIASFMDGETLLILLSEVTVNTLSNAKGITLDHLPKGTIIMMVNHNFDVLLSSMDGQLDVVSIDNDARVNCGNTECQSDNELIISSMNYIRYNMNITHHQESDVILRLYDEDNEFYLSIFPFKMTYLSFFSQSINHLILNQSDAQYGYVVIANNSEFFDLIQMAWYLVIGITVFMLLVGVINICYHIQYDIKQVQRNLAKVASRSELIYQTTKAETALALRAIETFASSSNAHLPTPTFRRSATSAIVTDGLRGLKRKKKPIVPPILKGKTVDTYARHVPLTPTNDDCMNQQIRPRIGDKVRTICGKVGTVQLIGKALRVDDKDSALVAIQLIDPGDDDEPCIFVKLNEVEVIISKDEVSMEAKDEEEEEEHEVVRKRHFFIPRATPEYLHTSTPKSVSETDKNCMKRCKECHLSKKGLLVVTWLQILITFIVVAVIWEVYSAKATNILLHDIVPKHEYNEVADEVYNMFDISNKIKESFQSRYQGVIDQNDDVAMDHFFINMMKSYERANSDLSPFMVYVGLPDGGFRGVVWKDDEMRLVRRDNDTAWARTYSAIVDGDIVNYEMELGREYLYDPRCRPWFTSAISNTFSGNIDDAFPNNSFEIFYHDTGHASLTANCKSAKTLYMDLFNVSYNDTASRDELFSIDNANYSVAWARYIFAEFVTIGLTASAPILDDNGKLVGVVAIDWVLSNLGDILKTSTDNKSNWFSWIIEANEALPVMIASSDGITLTNTQSLEGCLTFSGGDDDQQVPYVCTDHPEYMIRVMSKELFQVPGRSIAMLPQNEMLSLQMAVPIGLPIVEVARIQYYATQLFEDIPFNVDWVIFKTIDISYLATDDVRFSIILLGTTMFCVSIIFVTFSQQQQSDAAAEEGIEEECGANRDLTAVMNKMKPIILGSANTIWSRLHANYEGILSTTTAQDFCANRANEHIAAHDTNTYYSMLIKCCLITSSRPCIVSFLEQIDSDLYNFAILFVIVTHLVLSLLEPATPKQLAEQGLESNLVIASVFCIFVEFVDLIVIGIRRLIEFSLDKESLLRLYELNYDMNHRYVRKLKHIPSQWERHRAIYLVFCGPKCSKYLAHIVLLMLILFNLILTIYARIGIFSYYIPILPFLFILRSKHIKQFGRDFAHALAHSGDVIFSYFCFVAIFSVFAMSLLSEIDDTEFDSISHAVVAAFVYISTAENYSLIYNMFDSAYYRSKQAILLNALSFLLVCGLLGLFCFIPMIIHRFEEAFSQCQMTQKRRDHFRKTNCIIAAFIMLDMNDDLTIDAVELAQLVDKSMLDCATHAEAEKDELDLVSFVQYLLRHKFRRKLLAAAVPSQSRMNAFLECNLFRRHWYDAFIFVTLVVPVFVVSILRGLNGVDNETLDSVLFFFFTINWLEINLRWYAFGWTRFWDIWRYPNPNYVVSAINKYRTSSAHLDVLQHPIHATIRLTSNERRWATAYLKETRPLSITEKATLTLMHRIQLSSIYVTLALYVACTRRISEQKEGYQTYFLQFSVLLRTFTLLKTNQKLTYSVFTVFPQFVALIIFLGLYIYAWARLGCALFGDDATAIVIDDVYAPAPGIVANFDTIGYSLLCLVQLMVGEGWHEVMYLNVIASTSFASAAYFMIYITVVTLIISNIFVGLFLAGIDDLQMEEAAPTALKALQKANQKSSAAFHKYAIQQIQLLKFKLSQSKDQMTKTKQQIKLISFLLKQHQQKHRLHSYR
eukprot:39554_1